MLVATNGVAALTIAQEMTPDLVLLDAVMPGMDGFEVCKKLKEDLNTQAIPVIFMTGLTESEHVVKAFSSGAIDYVTKPLNTKEVLARLAAHLGNARLMSRTQNALDAFGQAAIAVLPKTDKVIWQTPLAKQLLNQYFEVDERTGQYDFSVLSSWINQLDNPDAEKQFKYNLGSGTLLFSSADIRNEEQWLLLIREESEENQIQALRTIFKLTNKESEVLYWVMKGKTDKIIAQILGSSPRTVNKHVEHVLIKMGAESRTSAAAMAMNSLHGSMT